MSLTQAALSIGVSKSYLSELEADKKNPAYDVLQQIAGTYKIPVSLIVFLSEEISEEKPTISAVIKSKASKKWLSILKDFTDAREITPDD